MRRLSLPAWTGFLLLTAAVTVAVGWLAQIPPLMRLATGSAMVLNSALCFGLVGLALLSEGREAKRRRSLQTSFGAAIVVIAALVLAQHVFGFELGLDWRALHAWYRDDNPQPGRMSAPTALAFVLAGATLLLQHRVRGLWSGIVIQVLTTLVVIAGAVGIVSALLKLRLVYEHYSLRQMALATAIGFVLSGAGLWLCWRRHAWYLTRALIGSEARRISLNGIVVLASIVCVSMLAGLVIMQRQLEVLAGSALSWPLESRASQFRTNIDLRTGRAAVIGTRPELAGLMRRLTERPGERETLERLRESAETYLPLGFVGMAFVGPEYKEWLKVGRLVEQPALAIALRATPHPSTLMWSEESYVLRTRIPMFAGGEPVGFVVTEQRLTDLGAAMDRAGEFAATGEVAVCGRREERLACFPQRYVPEAFTIPYDAALPVARALAGETGVTITRDERSNNVIAAYGPVGSLGLGMVLKMRTAELYAPLREALAYVLVLALLLVAGGTLLLYWRVIPLVHRLYLSDQRLKLALDSSRSAWWDWDIGSGRVELSEHWQAMLGEADAPTVTTLAELQALVHPDDLPMLQRKLRVAVKNRDIRYDVEHRVRRPDGKWMWISSIGMVVERDAQDRALRMIGINADVSLRKETALKIEHQASHDVLTGLANRLMFRDRLVHAMARVQRNKTLMAIMYLDIDRFKGVNDTFGHAVGDLLLKDFAQRLAYCVRTVDTVARIGGDEFAVVLEDLGSRDDGCRIAEKIVKEMEPEFPLEHHAVEVTTSVGVAFYDGSKPLTVDQLVRGADSALYEAKDAGRNTWRVAG